MRSIVITFDSIGHPTVEQVGVVSIQESINAASGIITGNLAQLFNSGVPTEQVEEIGGAICERIGKTYRLHAKEAHK